MKICIENSYYPEQLRKIKNPPKQLYLKGNIELLNSVGVAIIGSRKCTQYGKKMAKSFSKELSLQGLTIISGMAEGIDSFAHLGCLEVAGNTIAVLPSGFNNIYPSENIGLYNDIVKNNGLVLTEYEENTKESSKRFLERNRIVSGLSIGILVVEGGNRSGASVTARLAREQGKRVFCIPSSLENSKGIVPNRLIKEGAFLVTDVEDVIDKYSDLKLSRKCIEKIKFEDDSISDEYKMIYDVLDKENVLYVDEIAKRLRLNISEVNYKLMMLELDDKIVSLPGGCFKRK